MGSGPDLLPPDPGCSARANGQAALILLTALQRFGLRHLVLCPGSRSAPLAVAAALLEPRGLRLHTAIDERSAAFFALGLGRALGQPAAVVTTSGTAVAQLLAATVEADLGTIPLLLLSADRPQRLKNCGANQAVPQERFLLACCRRLLEGPPQGLTAAAPERLEALAAAAMAAACGDGRTAPAGPVHLNLPFEEPLHADGTDVATLATWLERAAGGPTPLGSPAAGPPAETPSTPRASWGETPDGEAEAPGAGRQAAGAVPRLDPDRPGVLVAGPWRGAPQQWQAHVRALRRWQRRSGWPLLADALSGLRGLPDLELISAYDLLLESPEAQPPPAQVLRLGSLPASRRLQRWLENGGRQVLVSDGDPRRLDPLGLVPAGGQWSGGLAAWVEAVLGPAAPTPDLATAAAQPREARDEAQRWRQLEQEAQMTLERQLGAGEEALQLSGSGGAGAPMPAGGDHHTGRDRAGRDAGDDEHHAQRRGETGEGGEPGLRLEAAANPVPGEGRDPEAGQRHGSGRPPAGAEAGDAGPPPSEPWLARALSRLLPPGLPVMLASSSPVRDWESFTASDAPWRPIHGFRGASGIDGTLSIACGLAEALGQLVLVSGDLALLHDANGWLWARQLRGRLTVVLIENGGGGIFEQLPIRTQPPERLDFERLFAMPQGVDQLALAAVHGVPGRRLRRTSDLAGDLDWALSQPFALLELRTHRREDAALRQRLRQLVCAAAVESIGRMASPDPERP